MSSTPESSLSLINRVLWIVDNARVKPRACVDADGTVTPNPDQTIRLAAGAPEAADAVDSTAEEGVALVDLLEAVARPDKRGAKRQGLTARTWLTLFIAAGAEDHHKITSMHRFATGTLPREKQWELGILTRDPATGNVREMTAKQLYTFTENINRSLDTDPGFELDESEIARRNTILNGIADALLVATHVVPRVNSSVSVDDSGVWAWTKDAHKPQGVSLAAPQDLDVITEEDIKKQTGKAAQSPAGESAILLDEQWADDAPADEDAETIASTAGDNPADATDSAEQRSGGEAGDDPAEQDPRDTDESDRPKKRGPRPCWFARWGAKTHKSGRRSTYYGYALHAIIRVADIIKGGGLGARTDPYAEPHLVEQFAITPASTDIVDVTLGMIKAVIGRGGKITDLIGDRHYSYKKFHRWALPLWKLGIRQVLDLRQTDLGPIDYDGAIILAGTPHLGVPERLWKLERPVPGAAPEAFAKFKQDIAERRKYAMVRQRTAWEQRDGKTRWTSPAVAGTVGCRHVDGSVEIAIANGLPVLDPDSHHARWCTQKTVLIPAGPHVKYQQEEYWGSPNWDISYNRRTFIEGLFGALKSHHTGNIRRGFMCMTGRAMVTITMAAAIVNYNLRELENWYERATEAEKADPTMTHHDLLDLYAEHPLHQQTEYQYGHTMLTAETQAILDEACAPTGAREQTAA